MSNVWRIRNVPRSAQLKAGAAAKLQDKPVGQWLTELIEKATK